MISPGLEPGTTSVLDWCDNQLHHETVLLEWLLFAMVVYEQTCCLPELVGGHYRCTGLTKPKFVL